MFSALMIAYGKGGQWERALAKFEALKAAGMQPNVITYNSLISVLGAGGMWEKALSKFDELRVAGLQPTVITYSALISALSTGGEPQWLRALVLFDQMLSAGIPPSSLNNVACCEIIDVMLKLERRSEAVAFFRGRCSQESAPIFPRPRSVREVLTEGGPLVPVSRFDLHNLSPPTARVAVLEWLLDLRARDVPASAELDVVIVTGQGNSSPIPGGSSVREAVLGLLTAELKPPLLCKVPEHNPGRIHVSASDWAAWLKAVDLEAWLQGR